MTRGWLPYIVCTKQFGALTHLILLLTYYWLQISNYYVLIAELLAVSHHKLLSNFKTCLE